MSGSEGKKSFWTTLPGILTGVTGLIGAIASLIAALAAIGVFDSNGQDAIDGRTSETRPLGKVLTETRIAFLSDSTGECKVHSVYADGTSEKPLTKDAGVDLRPDWSPDGKMIAFANNADGDFDVYLTDAATGQTRVLLDTDADEKGPTWSPVGDRIAFSSTADGHSEIWAMDSYGTGSPVQLTNEDAKSVSPDWSPDDDAIVFASDSDGQFNIFVMRTDGTDPQSLTANAPDSSITQEFDPSWSSDGEKISFDGRRSDDGSFDIYVIDPDGSDLKNLTAHSANDRRSSWSPDDTKIVFGSDREVPSGDTQRGCSVDTRQMDLYVMNADGTDPQRLLGSEADDSSPAWGPAP